ncbi:DNA-binding transcriptional regulator, AcrR family [Microlunatus sagamiharensis]|uniref:DNA-binding transcriptional regulator, AcrR family n=1 Tax=Microlunatus sagamiharensis TaxID=546874 RepID=A0A1H2N294_9ACTN|nr:TetR family transcriptional regulator [Microlunatus sagamiharensis]SDU99637.1 DNA-binding transcriptional regulator, AcrR family [Microlunatus sagamiharensis]
MPPRDADATRARIMAAATAEFAEHGLAGGRVDRIAAAARTNKAQLYHYFGNKETLFDLVFDRYVQTHVTNGWFDPERLPEYAAGVYDYYVQDPVLVRLATWARLERTPTGDLYARAGGVDVQVVARIEMAQAQGVVVDTINPLDVYSLVVGMASSWAQSSLTFTATADDPEAEHARRRTALADAVRAAFCR